MTASVDRVSQHWPRWARRLRRTLGVWRHDPYRAVLDILGSPVAGMSTVPGDWRSERIRSGGRTANRTLGLMVGNDGFELGAWWYYDDANGRESPAFSLNRGEAHRLAWFVLRWWAVEWFGLRRIVWYWALHRHVAKFKAARPVAPTTVRNND